MEDITRIIGGTLETLLAQGWRPPISLTVMGANGTALVGRYIPADDGFAFETLAETYGENGFAVPVNLFFTNAKGQAARVLLETEGGAPQLFN